jgi:DNA-directed RNA polymerase specialized sigma24 family protein
MSYQIWEAGGLGPGASSVADSRASVTALFREHHAELVRLAVLMTGDRASAEDIVQDVFARLCARDQLPDSGGAVAYGAAPPGPGWAAHG